MEPPPKLFNSGWEFMAVLGSLITIIGVIVECVELLAKCSKNDWCRKWGKRIIWHSNARKVVVGFLHFLEQYDLLIEVVGFILVVGGLGLELYGGAKELVDSHSEDRRLQKELATVKGESAKANERAGNAEKEAGKANERASSNELVAAQLETELQPRNITVAQWTNMMQMLSPFKGPWFTNHLHRSTGMFLDPLPSDPQITLEVDASVMESVRIAKQLENILRDFGGFNVKLIYSRPWFLDPKKDLDVGFTFVWNERNGKPAHVESLMKAFVGVGLASERGWNSLHVDDGRTFFALPHNVAAVGTNEVKIIVGVRPWRYEFTGK